MKIHHLAVEEAFLSLHSRPEGLTSEEAGRRLTEFGHNRVKRLERTPLWQQFAHGFTHFFALILWIAVVLAFLAEYFEPGASMATLGCAILGVIVINGLFSFWQEYRAERALAALQELLPHEVKVARDRKVQQLPAAELVPGDVILLDDGDDIPADCRVVEAFAVRVNNATVTGESLPKGRDAHPSQEELFHHSRNILLAGTSMVAGQARALVFATGMQTEFGQIAHLSQDSRARLSPLQKEIVRLSRVVAVLALVLGVVFFLIGQMLGLSFWHNFIFAIGIIVANVPEGLLPTVTLSLAMASQRMARRQALIRHLPSVETLGCATVICTDKTGTLTENRMEVQRLFFGGQFQGVEAANARSRRFFEVAVFCHTLKQVENHGQATTLGDPMEIALVEMGRQLLPAIPDYPREDEVPFDSDRKRLSTLNRTPDGLVLYTKGALETVLPLCQRIECNGKVESLTTDWSRKLLEAQDAMAEDGLRVLAFAYRQVMPGEEHDRLEEDLVLCGLVGLRDPPRPEVPAAMRQCQAAGIKVIMVTGDHPETARAIARQIGLITSSHPVIISGEELRRLSSTQLQLTLDAPEILFARVGADQKMRIVQALKAKGQVVAVTGDGVNDAPALRHADIGIAMGRSGTDVARAASDMVLLDDNFATIVSAIEEGRTVYANIRKFLTYILTSNVPELVPYLAFVLFKIPLALTIIQILAVDLGTDMLPALALGVEPPDQEVMRQPPRSRQEPLLNLSLLLRSYGFLGVLEATAAMAAFFFVLLGGGWSYGQVLSTSDTLYLQATTACLSAIIVMQVINVFLCRSDWDSAIASGFWSNPWILAGIIAEVMLIGLIGFTAMGNFLFATAPIPFTVWLFVFPFALGMFGLEEGRKWLVRLWKKPRSFLVMPDRQPSGTPQPDSAAS